MTESDQKLVRFALKHPSSIRLLDAGLAVTRPHAELRRRLYVIFALLEADTHYTQYFLARRRGPLYLLRVGTIGIAAMFKALVGIILVKVVG